MVELIGPSDEVLELFIERLRAYVADHPRARAELYRDEELSVVRIHITDPRFRTLTVGRRGDDVWPYFTDMPVELLNDLYQLTLVAPREAGKTGSSLQFQDLMPKPEPKPAPAAARTRKRTP